VPTISSRARRNKKISEAEVEKQFFETLRLTSFLNCFESTEEVASGGWRLPPARTLWRSTGLRCARKAASFAAISSFDQATNGGFPQSWVLSVPWARK